MENDGGMLINFDNVLAIRKEIGAVYAYIHLDMIDGSRIMFWSGEKGELNKAWEKVIEKIKENYGVERIWGVVSDRDS